MTKLIRLELNEINSQNIDRNFKLKVEKEVNKYFLEKNKIKKNLLLHLFNISTQNAEIPGRWKKGKMTGRKRSITLTNC